MHIANILSRGMVFVQVANTKPDAAPGKAINVTKLNNTLLVIPCIHN